MGTILCSIQALRCHSGPSCGSVELSWHVFWASGCPKNISKVSTPPKHAPACTDCTSHPPSLERGNRSEGQRCQNHTSIAPRALHESAGGALKSFRSAPKSPKGGPMGAKGNPKEYSGALAVPKCAGTHTLDGIPAEREVRSEAPQCVPKGAQRGPSPREHQGSSAGTPDSP